MSISLIQFEELKTHFFWRFIFKNKTISSFDKTDLKIILSVKLFYSLLLFSLLKILMFDFNELLNMKVVEPLWSVFFVKHLDSFLFLIFFLIGSIIFCFFSIIKTESKFYRFLIFIFFSF